MWREALAEYLRSQGRFRSIHEVHNWLQLIPTVQFEVASVVVCDVDIPDRVCRLLQQLHRQFPQIGMVCILDHAQINEYVVSRFMAVGVGAFVLSEDHLPALMSALEAVAQGKVVLPGGPFLTQLGTLMFHGTNLAAPTLTLQQRQILELLAQGEPVAQIALRLSIGVRTVYSHLQELYTKLGARNRIHAVALAMQWGMVEHSQGDFL